MYILERDWKIYRKKIAIWQENYMHKLNQHYIDILSSQEGNPSNRFCWKLKEEIDRDCKHPGVIVIRKRSTAIMVICQLLKDMIITEEDLNEFSNNLKEKIKWLRGFDNSQ